MFSIICNLALDLYGMMMMMTNTYILHSSCVTFQPSGTFFTHLFRSSPMYTCIKWKETKRNETKQNGREIHQKKKLTPIRSTEFCHIGHGVRCMSALTAEAHAYTTPHTHSQRCMCV